MYSRRDFGKIALASLPLSAALAKINSTISGVRLGAQTYSFRDFKAETYADQVVKAMTEIGLGECELQFPRGPANGGRGMEEAARKTAMEDYRKQYAATPIEHFKGIGKKFRDAGIDIHVFNSAFGETPEELDREFEIAKALGAPMLASSGTVAMAKRVIPFAEKHKMLVAWHGHSNVNDPNQFATPESFAKALAMSKYYRTNLDIGHFVGAGFDPVAYIKEHHEQITHLHLKDRKKFGPNMPWGEGETPIKPVLQLLREQKYPIPAYIEYEYRGTASSQEEVKKCFAYAKAALA